MTDNLTALRARDDLLVVAASWGALRARLRPSGGNGTADRVNGTSEPRLPIALPVSDLLYRIERHTGARAPATGRRSTGAPDTTARPTASPWCPLRTARCAVTP